MSDQRTYWNPYSRHQELVLMDAQVASMWPYSKPAKKENMEENDWAKAGFEPVPATDRKDALRKMQEAKREYDAALENWPNTGTNGDYRATKAAEALSASMDAGVPTDDGGQLDSWPPMAKQAAALNVATAASRLGNDMVNLPKHYARFKIEPIRFIGENKLDWFQGNIIKYVTRWDAKNGLEDLDKVLRYATMYRRYAEGDPDWWKAGKPEDFKVG